MPAIQSRKLAVREQLTASRTSRTDFRVDPEAGIIYNARILGLASRNRRVYPIEVLKRRFKMYEGQHVYGDHAPGKRGARPLQEWGGVTRDVYLRPDGVYGNVHVIKSTLAGRILLEAALKFPDQFGLSPYHIIEAMRDGDREIVQDIVEVISVDAVTRPATNKSLMEEVVVAQETREQDGAPGASVGMAAPAVPSIEESFLQLQNSIMASKDHDDQEKVAMLKDAMKLKGKILGTDAPDEEPPADDTAGESVQRVAPALSPQGGRGASPGGMGGKGRIARMEQDTRELKVLEMARSAGVHCTPEIMEYLLERADYRAVYEALDGFKRQQRRPYGSSAPRSAARDEVTPTAPRKAPPRLTRGATKEEVSRFYGN